VRCDQLAGLDPSDEHGQPADDADVVAGAADADREQRADGGQAAGQAKRLPQQNRGRRGPARPRRAQHRACAPHASHGDRG